jgi:hypothetical protein
MKNIVKLLCILAILVSFTVKTQATTINFALRFSAMTNTPLTSYVIKAEILDFTGVYTTCYPVPLDIEYAPGTYPETCSVTIPYYVPSPANYFKLIVSVERYVNGVASGTATGQSGWLGYSTGTINVPSVIVATPTFP